MLLAFPELLQERDAAERVKQAKPILVILGNPPYNGFAGLAVDEERDLSQAYRTAALAPQPQGQGLNDLYVRFYRMAERRIVEKTGKGIVCFISNYSWLDGLSFTGMRERYLAGFDEIWIDCLNGDKYKTGKLTPEGDPDPSVFSTEFNREGIQVGTAIALLTRRGKSRDAHSVGFRNLWGRAKRAQLLDDADNPSAPKYEELHPAIELGLPFTPALADSDYLSWPQLPELFPVSFPGVKTSRDDVVVDIDRERLVSRLEQYFDPEMGDAEIRAIMPAAMAGTARFDAKETRRYLVQRGFKPENIVRYCYRPFDNRWLYWEPETALLDRKREEYFPHVFDLRTHVFDSSLWLAASQQNRKDFDPPVVTHYLSSLHVIERGANMFPLMLHMPTQKREQPNLSPGASRYLNGLSSEDAGPLPLFLHTAAVLYSPAYRNENAFALRQDWPRIPLPTAAMTLLRSAEIGRKLSVLLNPEAPLETLTTGKIREELKAIAAISREGGGPLNPDAGDLDITAGWGHFGQGSAVMPGKGKLVERDYSAAESAAIAEGAAHLRLSAEQAVELLGARTCDVYLNNVAYWKNIPACVWEFTIGGYQVIKKWLSYRERSILGRGLMMEEARRHGYRPAHRGHPFMGPELDANYEAVKQLTHVWPRVAQARY